MHAAICENDATPRPIEIGACPEFVAIDELRLLWIADGGVAAGHRVADLFEFAKASFTQRALRFPIRHGRDEFSFGLHLLVDAACCTAFPSGKWSRCRLERDRLATCLAPVLIGLLDHAGDQIDVDLRKPDGARELVGAEDFLASDARGR